MVLILPSVFPVVGAGTRIIAHPSCSVESNTSDVSVQAFKNPSRSYTETSTVKFNGGDAGNSTFTLRFAITKNQQPAVTHNANWIRWVNFTAYENGPFDQALFTVDWINQTWTQAHPSANFGIVSATWGGSNELPATTGYLYLVNYDAPDKVYYWNWNTCGTYEGYWKIYNDDGTDPGPGLNFTTRMLSTNWLIATITPPAPAGVTASVIDPKTINVSWSAAARASYYHVHASTTSGFTPGPSNLVANLTGTYSIASGLTPETAYFFRVLAYDTDHLGSDPSAQTSATTPTNLPPGAPRDPTATPGPSAGQITLAWQPPQPSIHNTPILAYRVYRGETSGSLSLITSGDCSGVTTPGCTDNGLPNNATRYYRIAAITDAGEGTQTIEVSATTFAPPWAPQGLTATPQPPPGGIRLAWNPPPSNPARDGGYPVLAYSIYRGRELGGETFLTRIGSSNLSYVDYTCEASQTYFYRVTASSALGEGGSTPAVAATSTNTSSTSTTPCVDAYNPSLYKPESPTGNTPFAGLVLKPTLPGFEAEPTVNLANGELVATFPILHVSEPLGDDFTFSLTYRSMGNENGASALSYRWAANWLQSLVTNGTDYKLHTGDGRLLTFTSAGAGWDGPPGSYQRITSVAGKLELKDRDGNRRVYDPAKGLNLTDVHDAAGNHWTLAYGTADGRLETITDPLGRVATLSYASGVSVSSNPFYAANQKPILTGITDWAGRTATLEYDVPTGRLVAIKTPGATAGTQYTTRFGYDGDNRIRAVQDPEGVAYVSMEYDSWGRTTVQRTPLGVNHYFHYNFTSGITRTWEGNGNKIEWLFLPSGATSPRMVPVAMVEFTRGLRSTDPTNFTTSYTHNAQDEVTSVTFPAGNGVTYTYDETNASVFARGNLLAEIRSPGPVSASPLQATSQASITMQYTYDPVCNKPTSIVDPRGTDSTFVPPNNGTASAARYTTTITYNSACKPLTIQGPTVNPAGVPHPAFMGAYGNQVVMDTYTYNAAGQRLTHTDPGGVVTTRAYYSTSSPGKPVGYMESETMDAGSAPHLALTTTYEYTDYGAITKVTDPRGNVRTFAVDPRGRVTQETGPALASGSIHSLWTYDANDNLLSIQRETDAGSGTYTSTTFVYDALDRLASETTRPSTTHAFTTQYAYDGNANVIRRTGGGGEALNITYDERNLRLSMSGPEGGMYAYDANGNLRTLTDPLGRVTSYQHDGYDRLAVETNAQQSRFVTSYDPAGNVVTQRGLGGISGKILYERTAAYDEANRAYQRQEWMQSAATMPPASATSLGTAGRWVNTLTEYDARGLATRLVDDNGHVATTTYDAAGRLTTTTDPTGNVVENAYDKNRNLVQAKETVAGATLTTCPQVCTTQYAYDAENRLTTTTKPDGTTRVNVYDGRGNVVQTTDEAGNFVLYTYDDADRPTMTRRSLGTTPATYVTTTTAWDDEDRVQSRCDDATQCTSFTYVYATQLVSKQTPPTGPSIASTYDAKGNVRTVAYSSGKTVNLAYDTLDRLTTVELANAVASSGTTRQQFTYDDMGRVSEATDNGMANLGSGVVTTLSQIVATQQYDTLGRVIGESQLGLPVSHVLDGVGNVLSTRYPTPDGRVVSRHYDASDRLGRVWDSKGLLANYTYQGRLVGEKAFGGPIATPPATGPISPVARTEVTYDGAQRPAAIQHKGGAGTVVAGLTARFDAVGNRVAQKLQSDLVGAGADKHSQLYTLDPLYRTTSWRRGPLTDSAPSSPLDTISTPEQEAAWPSIDGQNDWRTWNPGGGTGTCSRATGTTGSPPVRQVVDACTSTTKTYTFDADGNLASDGTYNYRWDFQNRLIRVDDTLGRFVVGYGYDAFHRRVVKVFPDNVASAPGVQANREGWYTFARQHVLQESQPVGSILPTTVPPTPPNVHVIRQWVYGPGTDEVLTMDVDKNGDSSAIGPGDARHHYAADPQGNVLGLWSETGRLVEGYSYQAYGNLTILTPAVGATDVKWDGTDAVSAGTYGSDPTPRPYSPSGNLWFFTGRQYDPEIGLYNYRARHYHPGLGQFMSLDPIGGWGDPVNLGNPYAYVGNNPGSRSDPSGLYAGVDDAIACGGGAGVALLVQGISDLWNRQWSGWDYVGEAAGGCAGGEATLYAGPIAGGAAYGAVSSATNYGIHTLQGKQEASLDSFATEVGINTATGAAGGALAFGAGKVASTALRKAESSTLQRAGEFIESGLHAQKGPLARASRTSPTSGSFLDDTLPPNRGFAHDPIEHVLQPGVKVSRYGRETGTFVSPLGTPFEMRSLPASARSRPLTTYEVVEPLTVRSGLALHWYGQEGLGVQHELPHSIQVLIQKGILRRL